MKKSEAKPPKKDKSQKALPGRGRRFLRRAKISLTVLFLLTAALVAGGLIFHYSTREAADRYVPEDFTAYAKIESISELFDSAMNLQAAKYLLANESMASFYNLYNTLKSNNLLNSFAGKWLLDVDASLVLDRENRVAVVIDMGIRSLATRFLGVVNRIGAVEGLESVIQTEDYAIYSFARGEQEPLFLSVVNNLVMVTPERAALEDLFRSAGEDLSIRNLTVLEELKKESGKNGMINFYIRSSRLLDQVGTGNAVVRNLVSNADIGDFALISISLDDSRLELDVTSRFDVSGTGEEQSETARMLERITSYKPKHPGVQGLLPENTALITSLRFNEFKDFYRLFLYLNDMDYRATSRKIDSLLKLAMGQRTGADELFFDWIGNEAGLFFLEGSLDPVIYVHMENPALQQVTFNNLDKSVFLTSTRDTSVEGVLLGKIGFPDALMPLLNLVRRGLDAPYYVTEDDYLFLSMNGEDLAHVVKSAGSGKKLVRDPEYKEASLGRASRSNLFGYYNMNSALPGVIRKGSLVWNLLSLYAKGTLSFEFDDGYLHLSTRAAGKRVNDTILYPGYPRIVGDGVASPLFAADVAGNRADELIFLDKQNQLVILDASFNRVRMQVQDDCDPVIFDEGRKSKIFVADRKGTLYCSDGEANPVDPFPIQTGFASSFSPVVYGGGLLYFSRTDKQLIRIGVDGREEKIDYRFEGEVLYPPAVDGDLLAVFPRKFSGQVYLLNRKGELQSGWPAEGGGISSAGPVFVKTRYNHTLVVFLTQSGRLNCWDLAGRQQEGFPLQLDGVYFAPPVQIPLSDGRQALALLDKSGQLSIVSLGGSVLQQKKIPQAQGKSSRLLCRDADRDGESEVYIYGDYNYIIGLNHHLISLKGFPVKGAGKPAFSDLDFDGREELVCSVYDKDGKDKIYAWSVGQ